MPIFELAIHRRMNKEHNYKLLITWTGNNGTGTSGYRAYERSYTIEADGKDPIHGSADPAFHGDNTKYNPEEFLLSALSTCHMLWYLHLCSDAGIIVTDYKDTATGKMAELPKGGGHFTEVTLSPLVTITDGTRITDANELHKKAGEKCFIANSVNFPVKYNPECKTAE